MRIDLAIGFFLGWVAFTDQGKEFIKKSTKQAIEEINKKKEKQNDNIKKDSKQV